MLAKSRSRVSKAAAVPLARAAISRSGAAANPMSRANSTSCPSVRKIATVDRGRFASTKNRTRLGAWQQVERLLLSDLADEPQGRADVIGRKVVFAFDLLKRHATREAAHDEGHRHARAADHRFSVADGRVEND